MKRYGQLLLCQAVIEGQVDSHRGTLLVDTGSNHTVLSVEALEKIGCSPITSRDHIRIFTADGVLLAPRVHVHALVVLDQRLEGIGVIAHDLPFSGPIDGLLGMDVLTALRARIDVANAEIEIN